MLRVESACWCERSDLGKEAGKREDLAHLYSVNACWEPHFVPGSQLGVGDKVVSKTDGSLNLGIVDIWGGIILFVGLSCTLWNV